MDSCNCIPSFVNNETCFNNLKKQFENDRIDFNNFCKILQDSKSVISGGTILRAINSDKEERYILPDVDIYVNQSNSQILINYLNKIFDYSDIPLKCSNGDIYHYKFEERFTEDPEYKGVFENILGLYVYTCRFKNNICNFEAMSYVRPYQVIVIDDTISVKNFVTKFDLTFCQNYFDGKDFFSYHPICAYFKKGYITRYIDSAYWYRVDKYEKRGYTIVNKDNNEMFKN
jgi:hypothetical protein